MGMGHSGRGFHIDDAGIGVSQRFDKDGLCIGADGTLKRPGLVGIIPVKDTAGTKKGQAKGAGIR